MRREPFLFGWWYSHWPLPSELLVVVHRCSVMLGFWPGGLGQLCPCSSVYKRMAYSVCGFYRIACFIVLAFGDFLLFNVSFRQGFREVQHLSLKTVPKTLSSDEELMLRGDVGNSCGFHLFFLFFLCKRQFVVHFVSLRET